MSDNYDAGEQEVSTESIKQDSFQTSATLSKLATALWKAQLEIEGATKSSENPFFKSRYADLSEVITAGRPLQKHGIAITQFPVDGAEGRVTLVTLMIHESGEWIKGSFSMRPTKADPQGEGSVLTYARRYCYAAAAGIAQVDDDANVASEPAASHKSNKRDPEVPKPFFITATIDKVKVVAAGEGNEVWLKLREGKTVSLAVSGTDPVMSKLLDAEGSRLKFQVTESGRKYQGDDAEIPKNSPIYTIHNIAAVPTEDLTRDLKKSIENAVEKKAMAKQ